MMQLQPPTDNLYKFLAIAGLASILVSAYFFNDQNKDSYQKRLPLEHEFNQILDEYHTKFGSRIAHKDLGITKEDEDKGSLQDSLAFSVAFGDRDSILEHINLHDKQLLKLMSHSAYKLEAAEYWKKWFALTDESLSAWVDDDSPDSKVNTVISQAIEFRPRYEKSLQIVKEIWILVDTFKNAAIGCVVGIVVGFIMMIIGFVLWYIQVQRPQDLILKCELEAKLQKK